MDVETQTPLWKRAVKWTAVTTLSLPVGIAVSLGLNGFGNLGAYVRQLRTGQWQYPNGSLPYDQAEAIAQHLLGEDNTWMKDTEKERAIVTGRTGAVQAMLRDSVGLSDFHLMRVALDVTKKKVKEKIAQVKESNRAIHTAFDNLQSDALENAGALGKDIAKRIQQLQTALEEKEAYQELSEPHRQAIEDLLQQAQVMASLLSNQQESGLTDWPERMAQFDETSLELTRRLDAVLDIHADDKEELKALRQSVISLLDTQELPEEAMQQKEKLMGAVSQGKQELDTLHQDIKTSDIYAMLPEKWQEGVDQFFTTIANNMQFVHDQLEDFTHTYAIPPGTIQSMQSLLNDNLEHATAFVDNLQKTLAHVKEGHIDPLSTVELKNQELMIPVAKQVAPSAAGFLGGFTIAALALNKMMNHVLGIDNSVSELAVTETKALSAEQPTPSTS